MLGPVFDGHNPAAYLHEMEFVKLDAAGNDFIALDLRAREAGWRPDGGDVGPGVTGGTAPTGSGARP